ncbi:MAG: hypothetical protein PVJ73_09450 [Acidobacteriota bacterium]
MRRTRARLGILQIGVFVCGGILAPATHIAWHRPDHSHGPGGQGLGLRAEAHGHAGRRHGHPHDDHQPSSRHGEDEARARPPRAAEPLDAIHGHGSIAHFGLALLSAAPPLALPTPEPAGVLPPARRPGAIALFRPSFPLPRPPPPAALS